MRLKDMTEKNVASELKHIRTSAGVSLRKMAEALGMAPSSYAHYENPERFKSPFLPMNIAVKISKLLQETGKRDLAEEVIILAGAGKSDFEKQQALDVAEFNSLIEQIDSSAAHNEGVKLRPNFSQLDAMLNDNSEEVSLSASYLHEITGKTNPSTVFHRVDDPSMEPTLIKGHIALISLGNTSQPAGAMHLIDFQGTRLIRRLGVTQDSETCSLIADNTRFPPVEVPRRELHIIGEVIWAGGPVR